MSSSNIKTDALTVHSFTLDNGKSLKARITDLGATVLDITFCGKKMTLGFNELEKYLFNHKFFGSTVGRVAGRIKGGSFTLNGKEYQLEKNDKGKHHLHGEYCFRLWDSEVKDDKLVLSLFSPDGDEGYDGNLDIKMSIYLTEDDELVFEYEAKCDKDTPLNLTNHTYFNLNSKGKIDTHQVKIVADTFIPTDDEAIPTGEIKSLDGSALDLREMTALGEKMKEISDSDIKAGNGIDHDYILSNKDKTKPDTVVYSPDSDITLEVYTDCPCMHLYTGNFLDRRTGGFRGALCLETQGYSDSLNHPGFEPYVIKKNELYRSKTVYRFRQGKYI